MGQLRKPQHTEKETSVSKTILKSTFEVFIIVFIIVGIVYGCNSCFNHMNDEEYTVMVESQAEDYEILQVFSSSKDRKLEVTLQNTKTKERYEKQLVGYYFYEWDEIPINTIIRLRKGTYTYGNETIKTGFNSTEILREIRKIVPRETLIKLQ